MEHRDPQVRRKFSKRKPLVDVSNTVVSSTSSTYPRKLREVTEAKRNPRSVVVHDSGPASSIGSCQSSKVPTRKVDPSVSSGNICCFLVIRVQIVWVWPLLISFFYFYFCVSLISNLD